jgi:hypothetical protein
MVREGLPIVRTLRFCTVLGALAIATAMASAHWLAPDEIVSGLANDPHLRDRIGVTGVRIDRKLPRLLIISVQRERWEQVPNADRIKLAEEWLATWRHSVPEGVVAVLDAATEQTLVNYDAFGQARLKPPAVGTPGS